MTAVEGYAEMLMDRAFDAEYADLRAKLDERRRGGGPFARLARRLLGLGLKRRQYERGARFFRTIADRRGVERHTLVEAIAGFERTARAHASPARKVAAGRADAGLGLRATAERLQLGFVPLGVQDVRVLAAPERRPKDGVQELAAALDDLDGILDELPGFDGE